MKKFIFTCMAIAVVCLLSIAERSSAQTGILRGGNLVFTNSSGGTVTLAPPSGLLRNYTLTLPTAQSAVGRFLYDSSGFLKWGIPTAASAGTGAMTIGNTTPQYTPDNSQYLFDVEYAPGTMGPLPGAVLVSQTDNPNPVAYGLHVQAKNTNALASGVIVKGLVVTVSNAGSGTQVGMCVDATGRDQLTDYAMLLTGGNSGIGTSTPLEMLEVNGNVRISGQQGLKITEWNGTAATAGTMGTATLVAGTKVVATTSVTANSRIFLTVQTQAGGVGKVYVSARTAGTSFTITSTNATETSTVAWVIIEP